MDLNFGEAREIASSPRESIALALVLLSRIADALERLAGEENVDVASS